MASFNSAAIQHFYQSYIFFVTHTLDFKIKKFYYLNQAYKYRAQKDSINEELSTFCTGYMSRYK